MANNKNKNRRKIQVSPTICLYTDGSSFNNGLKDPKLPQLSASAFIITVGGEIVYKNYEGHKDTTNNYAELKAIIIGLHKISDMFQGRWRKYTPPYHIKIFSDSKYAVDGASLYLRKWIQDGYKNSSNKTIANIDLWKSLKFHYLDNPDYKLEFIHVKAHTKNTDFNSQMNDLCDRLAMSKIQKMVKHLNLYKNREREKEIEREINMIYKKSYKLVKDKNNNYEELIEKYNHFSNEFQLKIIKKVIGTEDDEIDINSLCIDFPTEAALMFLFDILKLDLDNPVNRKLYTEMRVRLFDAGRLQNKIS